MKISHISISKILTDLCVMCNNTKCKNKKHLRKYCLQCCSNEGVLAVQKETCLKINVKRW